MARLHQWFSRLVRCPQKGAGVATGGLKPTWRVTPPADPTQPLWLVPAYERQRLSGDRLMSR